jgi:DNA-binding NtrC family response regulator
LPTGSELLLLEDDPRLRRRLAAHFRELGCEVLEASTLAEARRLLEASVPDFAVADINLPDGDLFVLLREGRFSENTTLVAMTAFGGVATAVEAMRLGAGDYLCKPFEPEEAVLALLRSRSQRRSHRREEQRAAGAGEGAGELLFGRALAGLRARLDSLLAAERRLGSRLPPVLIEGETGTGKTVLAKWIHARGPRAGMPFLHLNCAALPDSLAESELFGHERGAFTDARQARVGLLEAADGGTLLLDEVGSLSAAAQAKLLTVVEDGRIRRLGGNRPVTVDARIIAASNLPLSRLVAEGRFREDLFHRLNLACFELPPLRERGEDILAHARRMLATLATRHRRPGLQLSAAAEARLLAAPWRGNLRELSHELERAVLFDEGDLLELEALGDPSAGNAGLRPGWKSPGWVMPAEGFQLEGVIDELVSEALRLCDGNVSAAARRLGVTREFLRYRLRTESGESEAKA